MNRSNRVRVCVCARTKTSSSSSRHFPFILLPFPALHAPFRLIALFFLFLPNLPLVHPLIAKRRVACRLLPAPARNFSLRPDRPTLSLTSTAFLLFRFLAASGPIRSATADRLRDVRMDERPGRSVLARTLACPTRSLAKHSPDRSRRGCPFLMTPRESAILLFSVRRGICPGLDRCK